MGPPFSLKGEALHIKIAFGDKTFAIHKELFVARSGFARAALSGRWNITELTITSEHATEATLMTYVHYIYTGKFVKVYEMHRELMGEATPSYTTLLLYAGDNSLYMEPLDVKISLDAVARAFLMTCHCLGDYLGDRAFTNAALDCFTDLSDQA